MSQLTHTLQPARDPAQAWRMVLTGGSFLLLWALFSSPHTQVAYFCKPSAHLSALFLQVPVVEQLEGFVLPQAALPLLVTPACSGATFFALLAGLMLGTLVPTPRPFSRLALLALWVLPAAWGITQLANTSRIITGWMAGRAARLYLPESLWAGVHLAAGILVFLCFLVLTHMLLNRIPAHEPRR